MIEKVVIDYDKSLITKIQSGHKWVCFGAGRCFSEFIQKYCDKKILPYPECVFDSNQSLWGTKIAGVTVLPPNEISSGKYDDSYTVVCNVLPYSILAVLNSSIYGGGVYDISSFHD